MADDEESLDDILSPSKPVDTHATTPEIESTEAEPEQQEGQNRDEKGRFASKDGEAAPEVEERPEGEPETAEHEGEPDKKPPPGVIEERRKRQAAEEERDTMSRQLAELRGQVSVLMQRGNRPAPQPQPEPEKVPDFWEAPDKFVAHQLNPVQQQLAEMTFRTSRAEAIAEFGRDAVTAAQDAIKQAIESGQLNGQAISAQLQKSRDPVGDVVRWHQNSPTVREASIREKVEAEILAKYGIDPNKPATPSPPPSARTPNVKLPPSLSRIPAGHTVVDRDESLEEILSAPAR